MEAKFRRYFLSSMHAATLSVSDLVRASLVCKEFEAAVQEACQILASMMVPDISPMEHESLFHFLRFCELRQLDQRVEYNLLKARFAAKYPALDD